MIFPCSSCGCCCKRVDKLYSQHELLGVKDPESVFYFPYTWNEKGKCEKYIDDKCSIYETRPNICSVDKSASLLFIDKKEFYQMNVDACNEMMDEEGVNLKFRIKL